jgi:hypothetical protein
MSPVYTRITRKCLARRGESRQAQTNETDSATRTEKSALMKQLRYKAVEQKTLSSP